MMKEREQQTRNQFSIYFIREMLIKLESDQNISDF